MTSFCNDHDRCFATCQSNFKACNDALVAGAYSVCDQVAEEREQWCLNQTVSADDCREERQYKFADCIGAKGQLGYYVKVALRDPATCEAFNRAQREFCECLK